MLNKKMAKKKKKNRNKKKKMFRKDQLNQNIFFNINKKFLSDEVQNELLCILTEKKCLSEDNTLDLLVKRIEESTVNNELWYTWITN